MRYHHAGCRRPVYAVRPGPRAPHRCGAGRRASPLADAGMRRSTSNAKVGAGRVDELRTNFDVTFNVLPYLLLSTGIFTVQPPFSPDNRRVNNPFINTDAAASNYSTFYASVTGII